MTLGETITYYRKRKGLAQNELADLLGITPTRLNYWEKDKRQPDVEMIKALSSHLEVSADTLIGLNPNKNESPAPESTEEFGNNNMEKIASELTDIFVRNGFIRDGQDISTDQLRFVRGIVAMVSTYFKDSI